MTTINLKIKDGKVAFIEQNGTEIPSPQWDYIVCMINTIVEGCNDNLSKKLMDEMKKSGKAYTLAHALEDEGLKIDKSDLEAADSFCDGMFTVIMLVRRIFGVNLFKLDGNGK